MRASAGPTSNRSELLACAVVRRGPSRACQRAGKMIVSSLSSVRAAVRPGLLLRDPGPRSEGGVLNSVVRKSGFSRLVLALTLIPLVIPMAAMFCMIPLSVARAERWLCPDCPNEIVQRAPDAKDLVCPGCGKTYTQEELIPMVAYINSRTRDTEISWVPQPEDCAVFRIDGMEANDESGPIWVPWSLVDYFIPRFEVVRLTNGRNLTTDYPRSKERCPGPPPFLFEVTDSLSLPGSPGSVFKQEMSETMAELFIVAFTPEGRDSARVRFIKEVEAGKHPRLPRTQPHVMRVPDAHVPPAVAKPNLKAETLVQVRVHENRGIIGMHMVKGSGNLLLDQEALRVARGCSFTTAGELGVGVPSWVQVRVSFEGDSARAVVEPAPGGFWRR
jgi:TonB family protein